MNARSILLLCVVCMSVVSLGGMCATTQPAQAPTSEVTVKGDDAKVTTETRSTESGVETEKARDISTVRYGLDPGTLDLLKPVIENTLGRLADMGGALLCVIIGACIILAAAPSIFEKEVYRLVSYGVGVLIILASLAKWLYF